eukprot:7192201-Prymnesium_polylepis.3
MRAAHTASAFSQVPVGSPPPSSASSGSSLVICRSAPRFADAIVVRRRDRRRERKTGYTLYSHPLHNAW